MNSSTKIGLIVGGVVFFFGFLVVLAIVGFMVYNVRSGKEQVRERYRKQTAETVGTITNAEIGTERTVNYTYQYSVNNVSYTGTYNGSRPRGDTRYQQRVGKQGHVCYDPADPSSAEFYPYEYFPVEESAGKPFCAK